MNNRLLKQLYSLYYKEIYLYVFSFCKNKSVAEDLTQETFLKALLALQDEHTNMRAWLYRVAKNLSINYLKRESNTTDIDEYGDLLPNDKAGTLEKIIETEQEKKLHEAINSLDGKYREILILQYFRELPQKEIARIMGLSAENVRVLSYRAKQQLKKRMEENDYEL